MKKKWKHIYGPVPSRRLGLSLGVDLVPYKTCNFDCIYCQLGRTRQKTIERKRYIEAGDILDNLFGALENITKPDFITLAGSGEPTLNSDIGFIIREIKKKTSIPLAVLTNGSLLSDNDVSEALTLADVILPSLDASDEDTFQKINRPHESLHLETIVEGLVKFREKFTGAIWLEIFFVDGVNTSETSVELFKKILERINPDKVQLNTAVRPPTESFVKAVSDSELRKICGKLGGKCEVIVQREEIPRDAKNIVDPETIIAILSRRPCTLIDLSKGLSASPNHILKTIAVLQKEGAIKSYFQNRELFYARAG